MLRTEANGGLARVRPLSLAVLTSAALLLTLPPAAGAAFPGTNGLIAYDAPGTGGHVGIWTANPNGSDPTEVTSEGNATDDEPAFSPDGKRIAFVNGDGHIVVMDAGGQNLVDLTPGDNPGSVVDQSPAWSPDGTKIAFTRVNYGDSTPEFDVWVMSASNGSGQTNLTPGTGVDSLEPAWSPDGSTIAFVRGNPEEVWTMSSTGANPAPLSSTPFDATDPSWSPDGSKLVFTFEQAELYLIDANGSNQTPLTNTAGVDEKAASWSPDGTEIVTSGQDTNTGTSHLYIVTPGTGSETQIPNTTGAEHPDWGIAAGPSVTTGSAVGVTTTTGTLTGTVNPDGSSTSAHFEWGTGTGYGHTTPSQSVGSDQTSHAVQAAIGSLTPGTTYHYRLVASNSHGTNAGVDRTFQARQTHLTIKAHSLPSQEGVLVGTVARSAGLCTHNSTASLSCVVTRGQRLAIRAVPKDGFVFTHWSGLCAGTRTTCTIAHVTRAEKVLAGFSPKPVLTLTDLHRLTAVSGSDLARACSPNNSCAVLAGLAVGSCQAALGGNPDVDLVATDDCFRYTGSTTDQNGNRLFQFTTTQSISADGVTFTPRGGPLAVSMYSDSNQLQHFSISGNPEVGFEGMDLGHVALWNIDPVHPPGSAVHYYGSSWQNGGASQQGNLPIPGGQAYSVLTLVSVLPPSFSNGIADAGVVVKAPAVLGGSTSPVTDVTTGAASKLSTHTLPTYDDGGSATQADNSCAANLAAPLPTDSIDVFHLPSLSLAGFQFEGHFLIGDNPDVGLFEGSMSAPSYLDGGSALEGIYEMGYPNNDTGNPAVPLFACARLEGGSVPIPVIDGAIKEMHLGIVTYPSLKIAGGGEMVVGQPLPFGSQPYPIDATGNWSLTLPAWGSSGPWTLHDDNQINFLDTATATGSLDFSSVGYVSAVVHWSGFNFPWPLSGLNVGAGTFTGGFDGGTWQLEGTAGISYNGFDLASADVIVSSLGIGGCGTVFGDDMSVSVTWGGAFDYDINDCSGDSQVQAAVRPTCQSLRDVVNDPNEWGTARAVAQALLNAGDCVETGTARDRAGLAQATASGSKPPSGYGARIKGRPPTAAFVLKGTSGPPVATVYGPNHYRCLGTANFGITNEPGCVIVRDATHHLTKITVMTPAAGTWLVDPDKGSPKVASFKMQYGLTPARVKAKVVRGRRGKMVLHYRGAPTDGRKVIFQEQGSRSGVQIGSAHGASGTITFKPSPGPAGRRKIVALISVQGVVHSHLVVATYRASAPSLPAPHLGVKLRGRRATVTIGRVSGAVTYLVTEGGTDKRRLVERQKTRTLKVLATVPGKTRVTITVAAVDRNGFVGHRSQALVKLTVKKPKLIQPAFSKRHRRR